MELTEIKMPPGKATANDKSPARYTDGVLKLQRIQEKINAFLKKTKKSFFFSSCREKGCRSRKKQGVRRTTCKEVPEYLAFSGVEKILQRKITAAHFFQHQNTD